MLTYPFLFFVGKLRAGDLLLELNGERLRGKTVDDVAAMLGRTGSEVTFKINRSDYDVSLTSEVIKMYAL